MDKKKNIVKKIVILAFWLLVWQILALLVHNPILLVGPVETVQALVRLLPTADFQQSLLQSLERIALGFFIGSLLGIGLAAAATWKEIIGDIMSPVVHLMKSVPVASFAILLLIWAGKEHLAFWIVTLVVFPILYLNTKSGLDHTDPKLLEMAGVFHMPRLRRIRYIYFPALYPSLRSAFALAIGMSWKSGVAAEVIGQPLLSVGNGLYRAKISLATDEVLAWTIVIIVISAVLEQLFLFLFSLTNPERKKAS